MDTWDDNDQIVTEEIQGEETLQRTAIEGFQFEDGTLVHLRPIPPLVVNFITTSEAGKPQPPRVPIQRRGVTKMEPNPDDPAYQQALAAWGAAKEQRLLKLFVERGVREDVPPEVVEQYAQYLPDGADISDIKFLWLADKMPTAQAVERFVEAVVSQTLATEKGIAESEAAFPNHGER